MDQWGLPGGKMNYGETPLDAAIRETHEETGMYLGLPNLICDPISLREEDHIYTGRCYLGQRHNDPIPMDRQGIPKDFVVTSTYLWKGPTNIMRPVETEEGITVRWVGFPRLLEGPFGRYNMYLFQEILRRAKYDWTE